MPPATTGAGPFIDPPLALTPLTVLNAWLVSKVHTTDPSFVEYARTAPSFDGENTTPGMAVTAENCDTLHARFGLPHAGGGGGVYHARCPVASETACKPPGSGLQISATGTYACSPSTAIPHWMPPRPLPPPAR